MATAFIAYITSRIVCPESLYPELAKTFLGNGNQQGATTTGHSHLPADRQ
jgi:hypothetical protein